MRARLARKAICLAFAAVLRLAHGWPLLVASLAACAAYAVAVVVLRAADARERALVADLLRGRPAGAGRLAS